MAEATPTFLLTNDDGIHAEGLAALHDAASRFGTTRWVAPNCEFSGCGHRVTTHGPIRVMPQGEGRWAVEGTPADCVRVGLYHLVPSVDWVLAGLNAGGNLGADVYISGTVAAVREAAMHGKPAIAFSQYRKRGLAVDWPRVQNWLIRVLNELLPVPLEDGSFWNVNFPHLRDDEPEPKVVFCDWHCGRLPVSFREHELGVIYHGNYHERLRVPGSDVDVCFGGNIAVTRLRL